MSTDPPDSNGASESAFDWWMKRIVIVFGGLLMISAVAMQGAPRWMPAHIYKIPEAHDGMEPNLPGGSYLVVWNYGYSGASDVERGDVLLYSRSRGGEIYDVVGRVVGLPNETVVTDGVFGDVESVETAWKVLGSGEKSGIRARETIGASTHQILVTRMKRRGERRIQLDGSELFVLPDRRYPESIDTHYGVVDIDDVVGPVTHLGWYTSGAPTPPDTQPGPDTDAFERDP